MTQAIAPYRRADSPASKSISSIGQSPLRLFMAFPSRLWAFGWNDKDGIPCRPAFLEAAPDSCRGASGNSHPIGKNPTHTIDSYGIVLARISRLLGWGSPAAVLWGVRPVIVNSINGPTMRNMTHIGEKQVKILPPVTDGNAATTVVTPILARLILTAMNHGVPDAPNGRSVKAMFGHLLLGRFGAKAATRRNVAGLQVPSGADHAISTGANALPAPLFAGDHRRGSDYRKASELLASQIDKLCHWIILLHGFQKCNSIVRGI